MAGSPIVEALMGAKEKMKAPKTDPMENPSAGSEVDGTFFLDQDTVGEELKVGDVVEIKAEVQSIGSKVAFRPIEVRTEEEEEAEEEQGGPTEPEGEEATVKQRVQLQ